MKEKQKQKLEEIAKLKENLLTKMNQANLLGGKLHIPGCCGQGCCSSTLSDSLSMNDFSS